MKNLTAMTSAKRTVGIHVFHQISFFFLHDFFRLCTKKLAGKIGHFDKIVQFVKDLKVQMKCFFLLLNLKEQQISGRSPFTVS